MLDSTTSLHSQPIVNFFLAVLGRNQNCKFFSWGAGKESNLVPCICLAAVFSPIKEILKRPWFSKLLLPLSPLLNQ